MVVFVYLGIKQMGEKRKPRCGFFLFFIPKSYNYFSYHTYHFPAFFAPKTNPKSSKLKLPRADLILFSFVLCQLLIQERKAETKRGKEERPRRLKTYGDVIEAVVWLNDSNTKR